MKVDGRVSVVTGAASGMGRSLVMQLAKLGSHVACCDVNEAQLEETVAAARKACPSVKVTAHVVDVANRERVEAFCDEVLEAHGKVHLLFANAGLTKPGELILDESMSEDEVAEYERNWDLCFDIDYYGVLYCVRAFLKHIVKEDEGYVILTSSVNGFWTWPGHGCYTAAKFAVRGLAESLLVETYAKAPHVHVACVHPGGVRTGIVDNSFKRTNGSQQVSKGFAELVDLSPDEAAEWILDGVAKDKTRILVGYDAILLDMLNRAGPHKAYDLWKALGREGFRETNPEKGEIMRKQIEAISPLGWLRVLAGGGGHFIFFMWPFVVLKQRRSPLFRGAAVLLAALVARRLLRAARL